MQGHRQKAKGSTEWIKRGKFRFMIKRSGHIILLVLLVCAFVVSGFAQDFSKVGTAGFVFLEIPVSARYQALGETGISMKDFGSEGIFVNPALIEYSENPVSLNATYAKWYVETDHMAAALSYRWTGIGTIGFSVVHFDFGEITKTRNPTIDDVGSYIKLGTYMAGAYAAGFTYARRLTDQFSVGTTLKYVRENIDIYSADNFVVDIGFIYLMGFENLRIGAFLQNFGLETVYANEKFRMPQLLKMGLSGELIGDLTKNEHLTVLAEAIHLSDANERIHLGLEGVLLNSIFLRAGYKFGYEDEDYTLGLGLQFIYDMKKFRLDFAYMRHAYLDDTLRYTLVMEL